MMRTFLRFAVAFLITAFFLPGAAWGGSGAKGAKGIVHKFGRGLSNTFLGWTSYGPEVKEHGAVGLSTGTVETIVRTSVGAVELGTFIFPNPSPEGTFQYRPLMKPVNPWESGKSTSGRVSQAGLPSLQGFNSKGRALRSEAQG